MKFKEVARQLTHIDNFSDKRSLKKKKRKIGVLSKNVSVFIMKNQWV